MAVLSGPQKDKMAPVKESLVKGLFQRCELGVEKPWGGAVPGAGKAEGVRQ